MQMVVVVCCVTCDVDGGGGGLDGGCGLLGSGRGCCGDGGGRVCRREGDCGGLVGWGPGARDGPVVTAGPHGQSEVSGGRGGGATTGSHWHCRASAGAPVLPRCCGREAGCGDDATSPRDSRGRPLSIPSSLKALHSTASATASGVKLRCCG